MCILYKLLWNKRLELDIFAVWLSVESVDWNPVKIMACSHPLLSDLALSQRIKTPKIKAPCFMGPVWLSVKPVDSNSPSWNSSNQGKTISDILLDSFEVKETQVSGTHMPDGLKKGMGNTSKAPPDFIILKNSEFWQNGERPCKMARGIPFALIRYCGDSLR